MSYIHATNKTKCNIGLLIECNLSNYGKIVLQYNITSSKLIGAV